MRHLVITTINAPTEAVRSLGAGAARCGWRFVVIGDRKTPPSFDLPDADYLDLAAQSATGFRFTAVVPTDHYARKNVGYLVAIRNGASSLVETDDDNWPMDSFWNERPIQQTAPTLQAEGWVNIYTYFTSTPIWPRGLPLDEIRVPPPALQTLPVRSVVCPVQQGLADDNPDVDAIFRLAFPLPQKFETPLEAVITAERTWSPFNSQNTTWFPAAYPLLYLPFHCSFRMTDIWRSFVVQRILYANGWGLLFHRPTVYQERNEHSLMKDFADEVAGYLHNREIRERLNDLPLAGKPTALLDDMRKCYEELIRLDLIGSEERLLMDAWQADVEALGERS